MEISNKLSPENYRELRKVCGLSEKSAEAAGIGLKNSCHICAIYEDELLIAMGRLVGDGGTFMQVVDICVRPEFQGNGLGKMVMNNLMTFAKNLPDTCYISLLADGEACHLYEKFGFKDVAPNSKGMAVKLKDGEIISIK